MEYYCKFKGRGHSWHQVNASSSRQAIQKFVRGSRTPPSDVTCQTSPPKGAQVVASGGQWYNRPSHYRVFGGKQYERFSGTANRKEAESLKATLRKNGESVRIITTKVPQTYYHLYVRKRRR